MGHVARHELIQSVNISRVAVLLIRHLELNNDDISQHQ